MKAIPFLVTLLAAQFAFLTATSGQQESKTYPYIDLKWKSWMNEFSEELTAWENVKFGEHCNAFFWSGGKYYELYWTGDPLLGKEQEGAQKSITEILQIATTFIKSDFPAPVADTSQVLGCQSHLVPELNQRIWFVELGVPAAFHTQLGVPFRVVTCIPVSSNGTLLCEMRSGDRKPLLKKQSSEQDGADQPATAPESKSQGNEKPKPESKVRPQ